MDRGTSSTHLGSLCKRKKWQASILIVNHMDGSHQWADLGTKLHPKARLFELLGMWGFIGLPHDAVKIQAIKAI